MPRGHVCDVGSVGAQIANVCGATYQCRACGAVWDWDGENPGVVTREAEDRTYKPTVLSERKRAQKAGLTSTETLSASTGTAKKAAKKAKKAAKKAKK